MLTTVILVTELLARGFRLFALWFALGWFVTLLILAWFHDRQADRQIVTIFAPEAEQEEYAIQKRRTERLLYRCAIYGGVAWGIIGTVTLFFFTH